MRNILYAVTACAQLMHSIPSFAASPSLEIAGLKTSYVRGGVIEFTVQNRDAVTVYFYCAIEWQGKDGEWRELPYSMEDGRLVKGDRLYTLANGGQVRIVWNPELIKPPKFPPNQPKLVSGNYRVKLSVMNDRETSSVLSAPFRMEWPN